MFKIGQFSNLCGLPVETLYHYEEMKRLVRPGSTSFLGTGTMKRIS